MVASGPAYYQLSITEKCVFFILAKIVYLHVYRKLVRNVEKTEPLKSFLNKRKCGVGKSNNVKQRNF